jgi:hypothetical protein
MLQRVISGMENDERALTPSENVFYLKKLPISSREFVRGLPVSYDLFYRICQIGKGIANNL